MQTARQVSVFLENKPGRLAKVLSALAREKINITAMTVMDSHEHNVLRFVTSDLAATVKVLNGLGTPHAETDVVQLELRNQPGALAHICEVLAQQHVNIDYAYCSSGGRNGKTVGVFKLSNAEKALRVLSDGNNHSARRPKERRPRRDPRAYQGRGDV